MPLFEPRSGESWRDPWTSYAELREAEPVHDAGGFWVLSRFAEVYDATRDTATRLEMLVADLGPMRSCPSSASRSGGS